MQNCFIEYSIKKQFISIKATFTPGIKSAWCELKYIVLLLTLEIFLLRNKCCCQYCMWNDKTSEWMAWCLQISFLKIFFSFCLDWQLTWDWSWLGGKYFRSECHIHVGLINDVTICHDSRSLPATLFTTSNISYQNRKYLVFNSPIRVCDTRINSKIFLYMLANHWKY